MLYVASKSAYKALRITAYQTEQTVCNMAIEQKLTIQILTVLHFIAD